jgi:hypothetical protein
MTVGASAQTINPRPGSPAASAANEPRPGSPSTSVANEPRFNCRFGDDRITIRPALRRQLNHRDDQTVLRHRLTVSGATHRPTSVDKRVNGINRPHFGAGNPSQARLTSLLRQPNESSEAQMRTSVHSSRFQEEPTNHFGGKRAADLRPRSCRDTKDAGVACTPKLCAAFRLKTCETRPSA